MRRFLPVGVATLMTIGLVSPEAAPGSPPPPNVVVIVTDDQRWDTLWAMPTLQAELADKGVAFSNGFVVNSLCCPSRASILTGRYSHSTGVYDLVGRYGGFESFDDSSTLATWLHDAGYRTSMIGKYMNGYSQPDTGYVAPGWDRWMAFTNYEGQGSYFNYSLSVDGVKQVFGLAESDYSTDVFAAESANFILGTDPSQPLFLYVAPKAPHGDPIPAPRHEGAFDDLAPFRPPNYNEEDMSDKPAWWQALPLITPEYAAIIDDLRRKQYETLLAVDELVGSILAALAQTGRLSDTLVVFTSDNGHAYGEHRWAAKSVAFEESIRVPMVVRYDPLTASPRIDDRLVMNIDIAPTVAELAGIGSPGADGSSLVPLLSGSSETWREDFLVEHLRYPERVPSLPAYCAVRNEEYLYVRYDTQEEELYDIAADPFQLDNRVSDPSFDEALAWLRSRVRQLCRPPPPWFELPAATVEIDSGPADGTGELSATFEFSASEAGVSFECVLDAGPPDPCSSPLSFHGLAARGHTFSVTGTDAVGGSAGTATWSWTIAPAGVVVAVTDSGFSPSIAVPETGGEVRWEVTGSATHRLVDLAGMGLIRSDLLADGSSYTVGFVGAGTYPYRCEVQRMKGAVRVRMSVTPPAGSLETPFVLTWAAGPAPPGFVYDVQIRRPGTGVWSDWRRSETPGFGTFVPDAGVGDYQFRSRLRSSEGGASGYSEPVRLSVTES